MHSREAFARTMAAFGKRTGALAKFLGIASMIWAVWISTHKMSEWTRGLSVAAGFWERVFKHAVLFCVIGAAGDAPRWALEVFVVVAVYQWLVTSRDSRGGRASDRVVLTSEHGARQRTRVAYSLRYRCDWSAMPPAYAAPSRPRDCEREKNDRSDDASVASSCGDGCDAKHQCSICLEPTLATDEETEDGESKLLRALPCAHVFHADCIERWLTPPRARPEQLACPVCKNAVPSRPVIYIGRQVETSEG